MSEILGKTQPNTFYQSNIFLSINTILSGKPEEVVNKKSLNRDGRKKELMKITMENQAFLRRLQSKKSCYSVSRWEEDFSKKEKLMKEVMCEYPFILDKTPNINNTFQDQSLPT